MLDGGADALEELQMDACAFAPNFHRNYYPGTLVTINFH